MKKYIIIISFLLIFASIGYTDTNYDFRNTKWGMTINEVLISESVETVSNENNQLWYLTSVLNKECGLFYDFQNNKLNSAGYFFDIKHTNPNSYIEDYFTIQDSLISKYKEPITNKTIWKNNLYRNNQQFWGLAISIGHLTYQSTWETETTKIRLSLTGDNYQIQLMIKYFDKNYVPEPPATEGL